MTGREMFACSYDQAYRVREGLTVVPAPAGTDLDGGGVKYGVRAASGSAAYSGSDGTSVANGAGAHTRPLPSSTLVVSDTTYILNTP